MAIALKSVTTGTNSGSPKTVTVVTSESPSATAVGDLVVVIYGNNYYALSAMGTPSATGSPTMNHIVTADGGSTSGHIKAYWYVANTAGAQTISATETGSGDEEKYITAYVLSGADTTTPVDGSGSNFSTTAATSHVAPAVSPASTDAFLIAEATSGGGSATASYTTPSPLTEDGEIHVGGLSGVYGSAQLSASGSTGTFTFTPANSVPYAAVTVAIKTAAGGGGTSYDKTPADAAGITDARTIVQDATRTQADAAGIADARAVVQGNTRTQADPLGLTDAHTITQANARTQGDPVGLSDAVAAVVTAVHSADDDAVGLTDTVTTVQTRAVTVTDPVGLTDTATPTLDGEGVATPSDPVGLTDSATTSLAGNRALADAAAIIDAAAAALDRHQTATDLAGITDAVTATLSSGPTPDDQLAVSDAVVAVLERIVTVTDTISMLDAVIHDGAPAYILTVRNAPAAHTIADGPPTHTVTTAPAAHTVRNA